MRLFWKACGADRYILERGTYSDQIKYFCLGGIVIATGVLAGVAGGYAIYTIFEPRGQFALNDDEIHGQTLFMASIFGLIWGLIIFNIDRFIVTSTGKGDGTEKITRQEFFSAIPRIIMGLIIALTISKPIEIRIFQKEIEAALTGEQQAFIEERSTEIRRKYQVNHFDRINEEEEKARSMEATLRADIRMKEQEMKEEETKGAASSAVGNRGPQWQKIARERDQLNAQLPFVQQEMRQKLEELKEESDKYLEKRDVELENIRKKAQSMGGLLKRIQLAHKVAGWEISLFITLLFIVIELTPIFFKMMLIKGPYDYVDENIKELAKAEAGIEVIYDFYTDKEGMEKHKIINHAAELKRKEKMALIQAQEELNSEIIEAWKKKKKEQIQNNPDDFIYEK
jgi:type III secretory pathway component EscR